MDQLREQLGKPIRIAWANRSYLYPEDLYKGEGYNLLVLCSASKRVHGAEMSEGGYIQGAGDDSESWAHGLTPPVFWANKHALLNTSEEDLPGFIEKLMEQQGKEGPNQQASLIKPTRNIFIGRNDPSLTDSGIYDLVIDCNGTPAASEADPKRLNLGCGSSKLGSRDLRKSLDKVQYFINSQLLTDPSRSLLVTCESGKDLSAGAILAILCLYYNEEGIFICIIYTLLGVPANDVPGDFITPQIENTINKQFIRQRLAWIVSSKHDVNPSRSTLQSVNAFLMQRPDY